jgi:hypothetical protein
MYFKNSCESKNKYLELFKSESASHFDFGVVLDFKSYTMILKVKSKLPFGLDNEQVVWDFQRMVLEQLQQPWFVFVLFEFFSALVDQTKFSL